MEVTRKKLSAVADKVVNSKVYKGIEKGAVATSTALTAMGTMAVSAFADSELTNAIVAEVNSGDILANAQPFITPAIGIMCVIGGIKLGMRFLRSSMH